MAGTLGGIDSDLGYLVGNGDEIETLGWTQTRDVYVIYVGQDIQALTHQLAAALAHVSQLEQQVANQPAPPTEAPPVDPKAAEALSALIELAKALNLVAA